MSLSISEITRISGQRLAVPGKLYVDINGNTYKGTLEKRLEKLTTSDKQVGVRLAIEDTTQTLNTYLNALDDKLGNIEVEITELQSFDDFVTEFLDSFTYAQKEGYKVFNYTGDDLTTILTYKDNTLVDLLYTVTLTYTGDNLTAKEIVKADNSYTLLKNFAYDISDNLVSITIT